MLVQNKYEMAYNIIGDGHFNTPGKLQNFMCSIFKISRKIAKSEVVHQRNIGLGEHPDHTEVQRCLQRTLGSLVLVRAYRPDRSF